MVGLHFGLSRRAINARVAELADLVGLDERQQSEEGELAFGPAPLTVSLFYPNPDGALSDPAIRAALQYAIDWEGISEQGFGGVGGPAALQTAEVGYGCAADEISAVADEFSTTGEPDFDKARKALEGASPEALEQTISMVVPEQAETQQLGVAVQAAAEELGLTFDLERRAGDPVHELPL